MNRELRFTREAAGQLANLENTPDLKNVLRQVRKTLGLLQTNLKSKSLQTHEYSSLTRRYKRKVFEAYLQQNTPGAWRIFWYYGEDETDEKGSTIPVITVVAILQHP